ncbi:hypothetical protein C8J57DRAFT_1394144 [Mycena rebaudengoi]|nr:hypothetical protein C8J57DRAFT_1394144 [Mycena rebaudengoi]
MDSLVETSSQYSLRLNNVSTVYDTILNIGLEWSLIKFLYLLSRYGTFLTTNIVVLEWLDMNMDSSSCKALSKFDAIFSGLGMGITEIILMVRTHALYGRSKKVLGFFVVLWLSTGGVNAWALSSWTESFVVPPSSGISCVPESSNNVLLVCYSSLLAVETIIVALTMWQGYHLCTTSCMILTAYGVYGSPKNVSFPGWKRVSTLSPCGELLPRRYV